MCQNLKKAVCSMIEFEVKGKIHGKQRPRFANGHAYTPKETRDYEKHIAMSYLGQGGKYYGEKRIAVWILATLEPPKSWSKKKRTQAIGKPVTVKPDGDNIEKIVFDGLEGYAYKNDKQVNPHGIYRVYGETEKLKIWVKAYD